MTDPHDENDEGPLPPPTMTSSQKISTLAEKAIEWRKKVGEGPWPGEYFWPTDIEFITAASPEAVLALRNEVLEEAAKLCDESLAEAQRLQEISPDERHRTSRTSWVNTSRMLGQQIRSLKHQRPADEGK